MAVSKPKVSVKALSQTLNLLDFCEKYEIASTANIYVAISNGTFTDEVLIKTPRYTRINESFFLRRKAFYQKIWLQNHEFYYMMSEYFPDATLQKACEYYGGVGIGGYIQWSMFAEPPESILNFQMSTSMWQFNKYARAVIRDLRRRHRRWSNPTRILDLRMINERRLQRTT